MRLSGALLFVAAAALGAALVVRAPAAVAWVCPSCYGLVELRPGLHVDPAMTLPERAALTSAINEGKRRVASFFGRYEHDPTLLVCTTDECDARLGGRGAAARAFGARFIHVSPRGSTATTMAHEFAHVELHARIGFWNSISGELPAWFDEGIAVIASRDADDMRLSGIGLPRCRVEPLEPLPVRRREWARRAFEPGSTLYAQAGCKVLRWIERHGGRRGALAHMDAAGWDPGRFLAD